MKHWQLATLRPIFVISTLLIMCSSSLAAVSQKSIPLTTPISIGILGDSTVDEYRGTDNRGGEYSSDTYNWLELLVQFRDINAGSWGNWTEPRREGYEYNWARSAATTHSLLEDGQHTGLAEQVSQGLIDLVIVSIGINDFALFNGNYEAVYSGDISGDDLEQKIQDIVANYTTAIDTILEAGDIQVIISTIPDQSLTPTVMNNTRFANPAKRQIVSDAIRQANIGIIDLADARGLAYLDFDAMYQSLLPEIQNGYTIGDVTVSILSIGDDPQNGILADGLHLGTVMESFIANHYLELINKYVEPDIPLLNDSEVLEAAGL